MADEIRVSTVGGAEVHRLTGNGDGDGDGPIVVDAEHRDDARREIQATRARISGTIDEIEESLLRRKGRIEERLDVFARARERPVQLLGVALGAGLLLGLLTGGGDAEEEERPRARDEDPAEIWERRARRLLRIAREQEEEIDELREGMPARAHRPVDRVRAFLADHLTGMATDSIQRMVRRVARA